MTSRSSGFLIQSRFGAKGNFEAVVTGRSTGLVHFWRNNDLQGLPWSQPVTLASGMFSGTSLIQSSLGMGLGLEVLAVSGINLVRFSRADSPPFAWSGPTIVATGVSGNPALIQSNFGQEGNFEVVVPLATGGIGHYWRDNDGSGTWHGPTVFGQSVGQVNGVGLIQSMFGQGNLEVVATAGSDPDRSLVHFWRDEVGWHGPTQIFLPNAFGPFEPQGFPALIQSHDGNFQVVVSRGSELVHIERDNSQAPYIWNPVARFGAFVSTGFTAASLIQSNFGPEGSGNFEVLSRKVDKGPGLVHVQHHWRAADASGTWQPSGGDLLGSPF
jgi:hypothetical protein